MSQKLNTFIITLLLSVVTNATEAALEAGEMAHFIRRGYDHESIEAVALVLKCDTSNCDVTYNYTPLADGTAKAKPNHVVKSIPRNQLLRAVPLKLAAEVAALVREARENGNYSKLSASRQQSWHFSDSMIDWILEKSSRNKIGGQTLVYNCKSYGWADTDACRLPIAQVYISFTHKNMHCVTNFRSWALYISAVIETPTKDAAALNMYLQQSAGSYDMNPTETEKIIRATGDTEISVNDAAVRFYEQGQCEHLN